MNKENLNKIKAMLEAYKKENNIDDHQELNRVLYPFCGSGKSYLYVSSPALKARLKNILKRSKN